MAPARSFRVRWRRGQSGASPAKTPFLVWRSTSGASFATVRSRLRGIVVLGVAVVCVLVGCTSTGGVTKAEILPTPFPARLTEFHAVISNYCNANGCGTKSERHCDENGCEIGFTFSITNPTDVDAYVQECSARIRMDGSLRNIRFPLAHVAGLFVKARGTGRSTESSVLPLSYAEIHRLPKTVRAACQGLDWLGTPPN